MRDSRDRVLLWLGSLKRAIAPVVGVVLMVVLVIILASVMSAMVASLGDRLEEPELDDSVNPWNDEDALLAPEDATAGAEDIRYRVVFEIQDSDMEGDSLNEVRITVDGVDESMFTGVSKGDIEAFEVEKTDGTVLDIEGDVEDDSNWAIQEGGSEIEITLSGSGYSNPSTGDTITIIFDGVDNPNDPGTYDISVTLNQDGDKQSGELKIIET